MLMGSQEEDECFWTQKVYERGMIFLFFTPEKDDPRKLNPPVKPQIFIRICKHDKRILVRKE